MSMTAQQLTNFEKRWISKRLEIYRIKYAEIYDEVYDHLLSACESKRQAGDTRPILSLFQETMDLDLGSHRGLQEMTENRTKELNGFLRRRFREEFRSFLSGRRLWIALAVWAVSFFILNQIQLPPRQGLVVMMCLSILPLIYMGIYGMQKRFFRTIRSRRKGSLVNNLMFSLLSLPLLLMNGIIGLFNMNDFLRDSEDMYFSFKGALQYLGVAGMSLIWTIMLIYCKIVVDMLHNTYRKLMMQLTV